MWPIRTDSPLRSTPWMNWLIILVNVLVFLLMMLQQRLAAGMGGVGIDLHGLPMLSLYIQPLDPHNPHLAQYFTYTLIHAGWAHIFGNMLFLYIFGNNVNDRMGSLGYLAFYLAGGVVAGIGYVLTQGSPVIGASGAVAAITGAYLVLLPRSNVTVFYFFLFFGTFEISSLYLIAFFFLEDVFLNFAGQSQVAHTAHIAGSLFGATVCLGMLAAQLLPRDQYDVLALLQRWNKRRQYQALVAKGYNPFDYLPPSSASAVQPAAPSIAAPALPDPVRQRIDELRGQISQAIADHDLPRAAELWLQLKTVDDRQVLSRQAQLDVANQLASQQSYAQAADAYERFLRHYPNFEQIEQVELMLGLIYARYLQKYDRAKQCLIQALARLHGVREIELAKTELARIGPLAQNPSP